MTATASDPFFWNDWQGDPLLRLCSHTAQSVWMRMLCIAAESKEYGFVLVNGKPPTMVELHKIAGGTFEEVESSVAELLKWGVCSLDRRGVIYCRRMVRLSKTREARRKGGKIGGASSRDNQRGIFASSDTSPEASPEGSPRPTHPNPSHGKKKERSTFIKNGGSGSGNGSENTTIKDPAERLARFQNWLADQFPNRKDGWLTIAAAADPKSVGHKSALELCKTKAREGGKGWPQLWPK